MKKLPEFKGRPLIDDIPRIPTANFLEGDFGKAVLKKYHEIADTKYKGSDTLNVLRYENNVVKGSNPFVVVLVNEIVRQEGLRTATPADLEKAIRANKIRQELGLNLRGTYEDTALVLRSKDEPNKYLAEDLAKQVETRDVKLPVMIPLNGLDLVNDEKSDYDLSFKLREDAEVIHAPILNKSGCFTSEMVDEKTGLPEQTDEKGDRHLFVRESGFSRLFLDWGLDLLSDWGDLALSVSDGRVVVVSDSAVDPEKYVTEINRSNAEEKMRLQKIVENAKIQYQKITEEAIAQIRKR